MPNTKSAIRRVRRVKKQTQVNRIRKSKYKNAVKQMELLIKNRENEKAKKESKGNYRSCDRLHMYWQRSGADVSLWGDGLETCRGSP